MIYKNFLKFFLVLSLFVFLTQIHLALATTAKTQISKEPERYQIEILLFEQKKLTTPIANDAEIFNVAERWPSYPPLLDIQDSIELSHRNNYDWFLSDLDMTNIEAKNFLDYQLLPASEWKLNDEATILQNKNYKILMHQAWQQTIEKSSSSKPIHIQDPEQRFEGLININKTYYFNVSVDFILQTMDFSDSNLPTLLYFKQRRRMRADELHYFDHPFFGLLVKIIPIEDKETKIKNKNKKIGI